MNQSSEQTEKQVGTNPGTERIKALSDGVFAIAITILVLQLSVPEVPQAIAETELPRKLLELWPGKVVSYMMSFFVIGIYWVAHHMTFHHIKRSNRVLLWLNIFFLMCVSFVPFPTAVLGQYFQLQISVVIYAATLSITGLALQLIWLYAIRDHRLVDRDINPSLIAEVTRKNLISPLIYLLSIALSFVSINLSLVMLLLVPVLFLLPSRIKRPKSLAR